MYSRQFSAFFFGRDIMTKLFRNVYKKITNLVDFFPNASVESDNFTKIKCGFFLAYLPNFLVGHLYILLNKKMFAGNSQCVFPHSRYYFLPNGYQRETSFFLILFAYGFPRHSRSVQFVLWFVGVREAGCSC